MLDIGIQELLVIMVLALLVFGPEKLPELGRRLGRAMREFRRASDEFRSTVEQNLQIHVDQDISPASSSTPEPSSASAEASAGPQGQAAGGEGEGSGTPLPDPVAVGGGVVQGQGVDDQVEPYWTSRGGRLLHRRECAWRVRIPASERIPLKAISDGWDQGLRPCPACDPKEAAVPS
jgi:sec-independent protein translocase protein TatA